MLYWRLRVVVMCLCPYRQVTESLYATVVCQACFPDFVQATLRAGSLPIVVVISPLVSIMKDQVRDFSRRGLPSTYITSAISLEEELAILQGEFSLVYISPEQLLARGKWREMLRSDIYRENMVGFVVDEAHCVKKW